MWHKIHLNGGTDEKVKLKAFYTSSIFVLPSHTKGIPNVILEAMATKTSIVATPVGGIKEILQDGYNAILAVPQNPSDLSEKILQCLQDNQLRARISENAYRDAQERFDLPVIKKKFMNILVRH